MQVNHAYESTVCALHCAYMFIQYNKKEMKNFRVLRPSENFQSYFSQQREYRIVCVFVFFVSD